jgi:hypothetical protein
MELWGISPLGWSNTSLFERSMPCASFIGVVQEVFLTIEITSWFVVFPTLVIEENK